MVSDRGRVRLSPVPTGAALSERHLLRCRYVYRTVSWKSVARSSIARDIWRGVTHKTGAFGVGETPLFTSVSLLVSLSLVRDAAPDKKADVIRSRRSKRSDHHDTNDTQNNDYSWNLKQSHVHEKTPHGLGSRHD